MRVKGLPIAYLPYLRMPDPSVDRARGFLVPEAVLTSNLASGLKLPYFIPLGISSDLLITPYFSSKTKTLEYRYRNKFRKGELTVKGAFSDDDLVNKDFRYFRNWSENINWVGSTSILMWQKLETHLIWGIMSILKRVSLIQKFP